MNWVSLLIRATARHNIVPNMKYFWVPKRYRKLGGVWKPFYGMLRALILVGFSSLSTPVDTSFPSATPQTANLNTLMNVCPFLHQNVGSHSGIISQHRTL